MTRKLFIGGIPSSGTTVLMGVLWKLEFAATTDPYREGQFDPDHPKHWYGRLDAFKKWADASAGRSAWWIEKSPGRFFWFPEIQDLWPRGETFFLMTQRNPWETVASHQRRWPAKYELPNGHPPHVVERDHKEIVLRLRMAVEFHREKKALLDQFRYVRYEDFCEAPAPILNGVVSAFRIPARPPAREDAVKVVRKRRRYPPVEMTAPLTRDLCAELGDLWGYQA